jgi:hypothetical protein
MFLEYYIFQVTATAIITFYNNGFFKPHIFRISAIPFFNNPLLKFFIFRGSPN